MTYHELHKVAVETIIPAVEYQVIPLLAIGASMTTTTKDDEVLVKVRQATKLVKLIMTNQDIQEAIEDLLANNTEVQAAMAGITGVA